MMSIDSSTQKRKIIYDLWAKEITKYGHGYGFCTSRPIEKEYNWIPYKNWGGRRTLITEDRDRKNKRISAAEYFLKQTTADFYISCSDDVIVDADRINELATILKKKYDTDRDLILLGNCQCIPPKTTFLQGGTGYIMTRRMATEFIKHSQKCVDGPYIPDDVDIATFLGYVGLTPSNGTIPYMVGQLFNTVLSEKFNFSHSLYKCPSFHEQYCKQGINNMRDVYIIHANKLSYNEIMKLWNIFQRMIHDDEHQYGYYYIYPETFLCLIE